MLSRLDRLTGARASLLIVYALAGAMVGIVGIHPAVLTIVWLEYTTLVDDPPTLAAFLQNRLLLLIVPRNLHMAMAFAGLGAAVGLAFGALTRSYVEASRGLRFFRAIHSDQIPELITGGETDEVEFKSTMRWDLKEERINKQLETVIAKTVAGFFNARGGRLLIGVADDGTVLGLEKDYLTLRVQGRDGFEQTVISIVTKYLGGDLCPALQTTFTTIDGKDVCMILVQPAPRAVYLSNEGRLHFYVRSGNTTRKLDLREAIRPYSKRRAHALSERFSGSRSSADRLRSPYRCQLLYIRRDGGGRTWRRHAADRGDGASHADQRACSGSRRGPDRIQCWSCAGLAQSCQ